MGDLWDWNHMAANIADLVDLASYWLHAEYAKWTYDADDPETKKQEKARKAAGVKPPPQPLIPPVAHRPPSIAEEYVRRFTESAPAVAEPVPSRRWLTSDEFDRALGLA